MRLENIQLVTNLKHLKKKIQLKQFEASKLGIKDFLSNLLNETKNFQVVNNTKINVNKIQAKWRN